MPHTATRLILAEHLRHPPPPAMGPAEGCVVMSIKPHYARLIERGEKRVEFRRRFPKCFQAGRAFFYVSSPVRAFALSARIVSVQRAAPAALWRKFGAAGGTGRPAFDDYFSGATRGVALLLRDVRPLPRPVPLDDARLRANGFRPPQSLAVIAGDSPLAKLVGSLR